MPQDTPMPEPEMDKDQGARAFGNTTEPQSEVDEDGDELPTEQEQLDYDLIVVRAQKMIFGKGKENILGMLKSSERPSEGMGKVAAMLIKSLLQSAKESGRELSPEAAMSAGSEIVEDLSDLAKKNGVFQYKDDDEETQELQDAMLWGVKYYGDGMVSAGDITPEMKQLAQKQVDEWIAQEKAAPPGGSMTPVSQGVQDATQPQGMVAAAMQRGGM